MRCEQHFAEELARRGEGPGRDGRLLGAIFRVRCRAHLGDGVTTPPLAKREPGDRGPALDVDLLGPVRFLQP